MARDLSDRATVTKLEKDAKVRARQDAVTLSNLMSTTAGRYFVLRKLEGAHIFTTSFSTDALQMAFNEGERNRGLDLLVDIMTHCPDQYILMMRERNERDAAIDRSLDTTDRDSEPELKLNLYDEFTSAIDSGRVTIDSDAE